MRRNKRQPKKTYLLKKALLQILKDPRSERFFSSRFDYVTFLNEVDRKKPKLFELTFRYRDVTQRERGYYFAGVIEMVHYVGMYGDLKDNVLSDIVHL